MAVQLPYAVFSIEAHHLCIYMTGDEKRYVLSKIPIVIHKSLSMCEISAALIFKQDSLISGLSVWITHVTQYTRRFLSPDRQLPPPSLSYHLSLFTIYYVKLT